jgi:hypothetical protein
MLFAMTEQAETQEEETSVWIRTQPSEDGSTYVVTLEATQDIAVVLTPTKAYQHAAGLMAVVARAEYFCAVMRQMTERLGLDESDASQTILALQADMPLIEPGLTEPLSFVGVIGKTRSTGQFVPYLNVSIGDEELGTWDLESARSHALAVLEIVEGANLDAAYYRIMRGSVGVEEGHARQAVYDLSNFRAE